GRAVGGAMTRRLRYVGLVLTLVGLGLVGALAAYYHCSSAPAGSSPLAAIAPPPPEAAPEEVQQLCTACHAYPPPATFPRASWRKEVRRFYDFPRDPPLPLPYLSLGGVVRYYESRAPEELRVIRRAPPAGPPPVRFDKHGYSLPGGAAPAVAHVNLVHL